MNNKRDNISHRRDVENVSSLLAYEQRKYLINRSIRHRVSLITCTFMLKPFRPLSHVGLVSGGVSPAGILASVSSQSLCKRPLMRCNRVKPRRRTNVDVKDVRAHEGAASRLQLLTKVYPTSFTIFHKDSDRLSDEQCHAFIIFHEWIVSRDK